jgi:hypothetical protein
MEYTIVKGLNRKVTRIGLGTGQSGLYVGWNRCDRFSIQQIDESKNFPLAASVEISTPSGISTAASSTIILTEDNFTAFELKLVHIDCVLTRWHSPCPLHLRNEENEIEEDPINSYGPGSNRGSSMDSDSGSTLPRQRFP